MSKVAVRAPKKPRAGSTASTPQKAGSKRVHREEPKDEDAAVDEADAPSERKPQRKRTNSKGKKRSKEQLALERQAYQEKARKDHIERFLAQVDNPDEWRTLRNSDGSEKLVLSEQELSLIARLYSNQMGDADYNPFEPTVEWFTSQTMVTARPAPTEPKRRFIPSAHEAREIIRLVKAIRNGSRPADGKTKKPAKPRFYDIWGETDSSILDAAIARPNHIAAPKTRLPGNAESYNPPAEYLFTAEEEEAWRQRQAKIDPDVPFNPQDFLPQKYAAMRLVPAFANAVKERFSRCLDLYLCPRAIKNRIQMNPDDLLPRLPDPRDLRPFPYVKSITYKTESSAAVSALVMDASGQFMVSAQASTATLWEVTTGRAMCKWSLRAEDGQITSVAWNPLPNTPVVALTQGQSTYLCVPSCTGFAGLFGAEEFLRRGVGTEGSTWLYTGSDATGIRVQISSDAPVQQVAWHRKGDYFATVAKPSSAESSARAITIHHLSRHLSQQPFKKLPALPTQVAFHPTAPLLLALLPSLDVARAYNLQTGEMEKQLSLDGALSSLEPCMAVHASGDHILLAGSDGRVCWFDLELSSKPYQTMSSHSSAVRSLAFHKRLPLYASSSADGSLQISHCQVFQDSLQGPQIVPVKQLHNVSEGSRSAVTACVFHPYLSWIVAASANGSLCLFSS